MIGTDRKKRNCYRLFNWIDNNAFWLSAKTYRLRIVSDALFEVSEWAYRQKKALS